METKSFQDKFYDNWDKLEKIPEAQALHMLDQCKDFLKDTLVAYDGNLKKNQFVMTVTVAFFSYLASVTIKELPNLMTFSNLSLSLLVTSWVLAVTPMAKFIYGHKPVDIHAPGSTPGWYFSHDGDYLNRPFSHLVLLEMYTYEARIEENIQLASRLSIVARDKMIYLSLSVAAYIAYLFSFLGTIS